MPMCYTCVDQSTVQIIERCGRFHRVVNMLFCWNALTASCLHDEACVLVPTDGLHWHAGASWISLPGVLAR